MNPKYIKFIGQFKDLKALGFRHQYMYARNYRVWTTYYPGIVDSGQLWIWMKGREVEIADLYGASYLIADYVKKHKQIPIRGLVLDREEFTLVDNPNLLFFETLPKPKRRVYYAEHSINEILMLWDKNLIEIVELK